MEHASKEIEKEKIRNRYKGVSPDLLEVIPAEERVDILQDDREKRVGVYVRVSTDDPRQTSSFELQRNHYTDLIDRCRQSSRPWYPLVSFWYVILSTTQRSRSILRHLLYLHSFRC